jgi:hypothetical protein
MLSVWLDAGLIQLTPLAHWAAVHVPPEHWLPPELVVGRYDRIFLATGLTRFSGIRFPGNGVRVT